MTVIVAHQARLNTQPAILSAARATLSVKMPLGVGEGAIRVQSVGPPPLRPPGQPTGPRLPDGSAAPPTPPTMVRQTVGARAGGGSGSPANTRPQRDALRSSASLPCRRHVRQTGPKYSASSTYLFHSASSTYLYTYIIHTVRHVPIYSASCMYVSTYVHEDRHL